MAVVTSQSDRSSLRLVEPLPLTRHPAMVYLSGLREGSRRTIKWCLNTIADMLTEGECDCLTIDWSKLRYHHTAAVRSALMDGDRYAPVTANKMLSALRRVLREAHRLDLLSASDYTKAVDLANISGNTQGERGRALDLEEITALLATCNAYNPLDIRDAALIAVLRVTGIRRSELVKLELADLDVRNSSLLIRRSKGEKTRRVYLPKDGLLLVKKWLEIRGSEPGALFCRIRRGGHLQPGQMHPDAIWRILQTRAKRANLSAFSPHDLRRTFCSDLLDAGVDIVTVQKLAGHASPVTTAKYDRRGEETKRRAISQLKFST